MNINLENQIKNEYVIVFAQRVGSGTTYYTYNEKDIKMTTHNPFFIAYNSATKYLSKEMAEEKLNELISNNFFRNCTNIVDGENLNTSVIHAWYKRNYDKTSAIAVVKMPNSHYLGKYGAYAFELSKFNLSYDNEHRYQCASYRNFKWVYLKINADNTTEWVDNQINATCMTAEEQKQWCDKMNHMKPFMGHVQEMNLPVRLDTPQKYYKGQKVLIYKNGKYQYTYISDVMARMDGKYYYALPSIVFMSGGVCITEENMYEGDALYAEDEIMLFDEVIKSYNVKKTQFDTYYTNVVLKDGTKIDEIQHF